MADSSRWTSIFLTEADQLRRFLLRFAPRLSPDDIAQETFARVCAVDPGNVQSPKSYIFRTARNLAINELRRQSVAPFETIVDVEGLAAPSEGLSPEDEVIAAEESRRLSFALGQLSARHREALILFKVEGLSHKEIGRRLGVSPRTVERYIADALAHCHKVLSADAPEDR